VSFAGAHALPVHFKTCPEDGVPLTSSKSLTDALSTNEPVPLLYDKPTPYEIEFLASAVVKCAPTEPFDTQA
jgi:hypothetical protein